MFLFLRVHLAAKESSMRGLVGRPQGGSERSFFFSALTDVTAWSEKLEMHHVDPEKGH